MAYRPGAVLAPLNGTEIIIAYTTHTYIIYLSRQLFSTKTSQKKKK